MNALYWSWVLGPSVGAGKGVLGSKVRQLESGIQEG